MPSGLVYTRHAAVHVVQVGVFCVEQERRKGNQNQQQQRRKLSKQKMLHVYQSRHQHQVAVLQVSHDHAKCSVTKPTQKLWLQQRRKRLIRGEVTFELVIIRAFILQVFVDAETRLTLAPMELTLVQCRELATPSILKAIQVGQLKDVFGLTCN